VCGKTARTVRRAGRRKSLRPLSPAVVVVVERPFRAGMCLACVVAVAESLGGRYALPRDAAMTVVGLVGANSIGLSTIGLRGMMVACLSRA